MQHAVTPKMMIILFIDSEYIISGFIVEFILKVFNAQLCLMKRINKRKYDLIRSKK
jgi:hypothetical protein